MSPRRETPEPLPPKWPRWLRRRASGSGGSSGGGTNGGRSEPSHPHESGASAAATEQERIILEALADLRDMDVREVMTPRVDVTFLTIPVHAEDIARAVRTTGHSCFPVVHDDLDDLIGILFVNDIFRTGGRAGARGDAVGSSDRERDTVDPSPLEISRKVRPAYLLPETLGVLEALAEMRKHRRAVAVVVDEYGGVAGLLTVKDLLEPLVGELHDEFDEEEESRMVRVDNTRWLLDGQTNVDDVRERLGMEIPDGEYVTLGGLLFERFGHIPSEGEHVLVGEWDLRVVEMDKRRVAQVVATFAGDGAVPAPARCRRGRGFGCVRRAQERRRSPPTAAGRGKEPARGAVVFQALPCGGRTGCGAAWLAPAAFGTQRSPVQIRAARLGTSRCTPSPPRRADHRTRGVAVPRLSSSGLRSAEQAAHFGQPLGHDAPPGPLAPAFTDDQARLGQDPGVVRDRRLTLAERCFEVAAAHFTFGGDDRKQPQANRIGHGAEEWRGRFGLPLRQ